MARTTIPVHTETRQKLKEFIVLNRIKNYDVAIDKLLEKNKKEKTNTN